MVHQHLKISGPVAVVVRVGGCGKSPLKKDVSAALPSLVWGDCTGDLVWRNKHNVKTCDSQKTIQGASKIHLVGSRL